MGSYTYTLINPLTGNLAIKVQSLDNLLLAETVQRLNYYSMFLITEGEGNLLSDVSEYEFSGNSLLCFAPYQPFLLRAGGCRGFVINFHPDFFCIHKHHKEVACNGVLFNNIYRPPVHELSEAVVEKLLRITGDMQQELQQERLAQYELLVSFLKIFLITASRARAGILKGERPEGEGHRVREARPMSEGQLGGSGRPASAGLEEPFVLQKLKDAIEEHYRLKHSAGQYAVLLNISPKALAKITKAHFNRTLTDMIAERIIIEAKRELYLTSKPVKSIAYELGFDDEYHFSRYFKNKAEVSPQLYRSYVGSARGETA